MTSLLATADVNVMVEELFAAAPCPWLVPASSPTDELEMVDKLEGLVAWVCCWGDVKLDMVPDDVIPDEDDVIEEVIDDVIDEVMDEAILLGSMTLAGFTGGGCSSWWCWNKHEKVSASVSSQ